MISAPDRVFLERTYELAARAVGNTSPNPPVGAVVVRGDRIIGQGYHHRTGEAHAEVNALNDAGNARGATLYVSLEPCAHVGRTPPCTNAVMEAGIARIVAGARDATGHGGAEALTRSGIGFEIAEDARALELIAPFTRATEGKRPFVALKMAMSLDGYVARHAGSNEHLGSEEERLYVRDLRMSYDAVMVGAGTVRIDDPQLTVRPPGTRLREFVRIVACERDPVPEDRRIFAATDGYARTIVLAPSGARDRFRTLERMADVVYTGDARAKDLDLAIAFRALHERGITSVLCEGGPTIAARLIDAAMVDRIYWVIAPIFLSGERAVSVLGSALNLARAVRFERAERAGEDVVIVGSLDV